MAKRFIAPSLADLRQDIAGPIPLDLIQAWMQSPQDSRAENDILSGCRRQGTIVSTDSAGLTKLGRERPLLEVMKLVSEPKEIVHAYGTAIGGRAVGVWAADNTEMFYEDGIHPREILEHLIAAQHEIAGLTVRIGAGVHTGEFLEIGGGVFGPEADMVELLAEDFTEGGEIAVSSAVKQQTEDYFGAGFAEKALPEMRAYRLDYSNIKPRAIKGSNFKYPFPFNEDFFHFLRQYDGLTASETQRILSTYARDSVVVLLKVHHAPSELILGQLTQWVLANAVIKDLAQQDDVVTIKTNGSLGIFLTSDPARALEFASDLKTGLVSNGYDYNIGIARGEVLVFPMGEGDANKEIAGEPVNIASKISEDIQEHRAIYIDKSVAGEMEQIPGAEPFRLALSHVELTGVKVG
jgi:class 3 adenylate cyclase